VRRSDTFVHAEEVNGYMISFYLTVEPEPNIHGIVPYVSMYKDRRKFAHAPVSSIYLDLNSVGDIFYYRTDHRQKTKPWLNEVIQRVLRSEKMQILIVSAKLETGGRTSATRA
jgi:hypothetical protein